MATRVGRLPVTAAAGVIRGAREKFGVELKPHNPCLLRGFYLDTDTPSKELTEYIVSEFDKLGVKIEVAEDQTSFTYKYRNMDVDSNFYNRNNNAKQYTMDGYQDLSGLAQG